ncbi:MAG: Lrp/AsnC ligand binding domain-containing protein [Candidatus Bathyarchaeia archaeon]|jgi:DNA-binding Lrp family transcriptional regulator
MKLNAFILINVNLGCEIQVLKALRDVQGFEEVFYVFGDYDMIAKVTANTMEELNQTVSQVRKLANIKSTSTIISRDL